MERASSLIFPGSQILAGWWKQLHSYHPHSFVLAYGYVHRVEAMVEVLRLHRQDELSRMVLRALALEQKATCQTEHGVALASLSQRLNLHRAILQQLLLSMAQSHLIEGSPQTGWKLTESGQRARLLDEYEVKTRERLTVSYLEDLDETGCREGLPIFMPLAECASVPWHIDAAFRFESSWMQKTIEETPEWKRLHGFPGEVLALVQDGSAQDWQHVMIDRTERILFILVLSGASELEEWFGFSIRANGWLLNDQLPILRLPRAALTTYLEPAPSLSQWRSAWCSWCLQHQISNAEANACTLNYRAPCLELRVPQRLLQRWSSGLSELRQGDVFLFAGETYQRAFARLTFHPVS